jgi:hypothetical protein
MNMRTTAMLTACLLLVQIVAACSIWDRKDKDLPENRNVKVVIFPVRVLTIEDVVCTQEFENLRISGTANNISPIALLNLRIRMEVFMAGDDEPRKEFFITGAPSPFHPGTWADFEFSEIVDRPVAYVELHPFWGDSD